MSIKSAFSSRSVVRYILLEFNASELYLEVRGYLKKYLNRN